MLGGVASVCHSIFFIIVIILLALFWGIHFISRVYGWNVDDDPNGDKSIHYHCNQESPWKDVAAEWTVSGAPEDVAENDRNEEDEDQNPVY